MDKYQKVKVLGKGSFGSAILIKRKTDGLLFVVKEVSLIKMSKKERDEARHECTVLQQLQHPNIVRYVEQFENRNNLYIVMEYCDGGDLAEKVKQSRGPMKETSVMYYFSQICLAMEYLHARHILHRDIKTMNVFLMKSGAVKLGDFGISTVLRNTMGMANTVCGTPYYFSPELCRNRPYNNKSDIWALGVLLYECATGGRHPFDGTSMNQLMQRIVKGNYTPLSSQYSSDFRKMVDWCLQKEPVRRPSIKQTLALPLVRRSLEQLEENLMLATQCRVRLKDIIDFESGMEVAERSKSPQAAQPSPRTAARDGLSPGQAAAMALAQRPTPLAPASPAQSPVVAPKPSAAGQHGYDVHRFYNQLQKRPEANPLLAAGANRPTDRVAQPPPPPISMQKSPVAEDPRARSPRNNMNLGYPAADRRGNQQLNGGAEAAQSPTSGDPFHADMRRVDAIIARYGKNTDDRAKETIHAYMRRKQDAYLKKQKEELETRERRNELRQRELKRVLDNQRAAAAAAVPPTNLQQNHRHNISPRSSDDAGGRSPSRGATPSSRAPSEDRQPSRPYSRSPVSSPSAAPSPVMAFGRDPRSAAAGAARTPQPRSRPTTPQAPHGQRPSVAMAQPAHPSTPAPPRRVAVAANSPLPGQLRSADVAAAGRVPSRPTTPGRPVHPPSQAIDVDWASLGVQKTPSPAHQRKPPALDAGIGGQKMMLQPAQPSPSRRLPALDPLGHHPPERVSPRHGAAPSRGDSSAVTSAQASPRAGIEALGQRPSGAPSGPLRPLAGRAMGSPPPQPAAELVDIPRSVAPPSPTTNASSPVEEALRILRRRRMNSGAPAKEQDDVPARHIAAADGAGAPRQPHRHHEESAAYAGMAREGVRNADERFLEEEQRRRKAEATAVPSTLEALRSLREPAQPPKSRSASPKDERENASPLALLKQRHRLSYDGPMPEEEKGPLPARASPPGSSSAHVTALSLGAVRRAPEQASPASPRSSNTGATSTSTSARSTAQSSMDGYAEMLQHLKDLLQRRRVTRGGSPSPSSPTTPSHLQFRQSPSAPAAPMRNMKVLPPLDAIAGSNSDPTAAAGHSPRALAATKPRQPNRPLPPSLDVASEGLSPDGTEDEEDDFEDAVPLSPVRCTELNDTYTRQQQKQKKAGGRAMPDDVYTNDVDLSAAPVEEELEGEEGYTGDYQLPSVQELLKGK